jgi:Reverse transcriptase (RNA-dependent DNA polymerase)
MLTYLSQQQFINHNQHGFSSGHSTCTQILETINDWSTALRSHRAVDAVCFDLATTFDSIRHRKLLHKLTANGITGDLLNCLTDFLHNCIQRVALPNGVSSFQHVSGGVPKEAF